MVSFIDVPEEQYFQKMSLCKYILRPKFYNMLYSVGDYNIKDILLFIDNLNNKDCYYKYLSRDILKKDFERWKRRRSK